MAATEDASTPKAAGDKAGMVANQCVRSRLDFFICATRKKSICMSERSEEAGPSNDTTSKCR